MRTTLWTRILRCGSNKYTQQEEGGLILINKEHKGEAVHFQNDGTLYSYEHMS